PPRPSPACCRRCARCACASPTPSRMSERAPLAAWRAKPQAAKSACNSPPAVPSSDRQPAACCPCRRRPRPPPPPWRLSADPGRPDGSDLVAPVTPQNGKKPIMPRGQPPLPERDVNLIKQWVAQGARDDTPTSDRVVIDMEHPPAYLLPPVIASLAYSPDGQL